MRVELWEPVTKTKLAGFVLGFTLFLILVVNSEPGFIYILDHANLLFHEAGHPLVGLFSARLEPYGGTVAQLVFPCALLFLMRRRGNVLGMAAGSIWLLENVVNIARYVGDARALKLPLIGGGDHDWNTILNRWGLLNYDTEIAAWLTLSGWTGIGVVFCWVLWRAWHDRHFTPEKACPIEESDTNLVFKK
jgi:hypothetical protein